MTTITSPSLASQRKIGFLLSDQSAQTDRTDILDVKQVTQVLWVLIQVGQSLRTWGLGQHSYSGVSVHIHMTRAGAAHTHTHDRHINKLCMCTYRLLNSCPLSPYEFQDTVQLKKDIAFTKNALKASYETKLEERANEL